MSYIALYRAFRPQTFSEVVGQEHVSKTLKNALLNNRVAHAYLFCGPRGTGKTSSAKILSKAINCLEPKDGEPCNNCPNCQAINLGNFLDVLEIDAASNRGIDEIRDIRDKVKFAPSQGKFKVYIIDEVHMLTAEAFNALLKTLEEPPAHVLFILATTEPQKIPLTILSRCQRFDFRKISTLEIKKHLEDIISQEKISITDSALSIIARKASGGMRDAISILDQCIAFSGTDIKNEEVEKILGTLGEEQILEISTAILNKDLSSVIIQISQYLQSGKDIKEIIRDLIEHFRNLMLLKISPNEELVTLSPEISPRLKEQVDKLTLSNLGYIILKLTEIERELRWSAQPQILLEAGLVEIILTGATEEKRDVPVSQVSSPALPTKVKADCDKIRDVSSSQVPVMQKEKKPVKAGIPADLTELNRLWPKVLEKVKQQKITTHAFLMVAEPGQIVDNELFLIFNQINRFHRDKVSQPENRELVEEVINSVTGMKVKINCILEGENEKEKNSSQGNPIIDQALELFGGDIVEIKD